jgi:hypothetical protein
VLDVAHVSTVDVRPPGKFSEGESGTVTQPAQLSSEPFSLVSVHVASRRLLDVASVRATLVPSHLFHCCAMVGPMTDDQVRSNRRVIHATCTQCRGVARGFTNLVVRKLADGYIEFDPHATGACGIKLDEDGATVLRDTLVEWLG